MPRVEGGSLPAYKPGAHIDLHLPNGLVRQFSLVVPNADPDSYVVGVKNDATSRGGSRYIIEEMKVGDQIKISAPRNNFPLIENAEHVVLVAGGIGITPIWCMAQQLIALEAAVEAPLFLPLARRHGVSRHAANRSTRNPCICISTTKRTANFSISPPRSPRRRQNAHFYCCGPNPMLKAFEAAAASRPRGNVHVEYFTPKEEAAATGTGGFWVELAALGRGIFHPRGQEGARSAVRFRRRRRLFLRARHLRRLRDQVISGIPIHHDSVLSEEEQATNEKVMICCCGCATERLVLDM